MGSLGVGDRVSFVSRSAGRRKLDADVIEVIEPGQTTERVEDDTPKERVRYVVQSEKFEYTNQQTGVTETTISVRVMYRHQLGPLQRGGGGGSGGGGGGGGGGGAAAAAGDDRDDDRDEGKEAGGGSSTEDDVDEDEVDMDATAQLCTFNPHTARQQMISFEQPTPSPAAAATSSPASPHPPPPPVHERAAKMARASPPGASDNEDAVAPPRRASPIEASGNAAAAPPRGFAAQFDELVKGVQVFIWSASEKKWVSAAVRKRDTSSLDAALHTVDVFYDSRSVHKVLSRANAATQIRLRNRPAAPEVAVTAAVEPPGDRPGASSAAASGGLEREDSRLEPQEEENPFWLGLGPEGIRRAIMPPPGFRLERLTICCDFGPKSAEDVRQIMAAYLPGDMADAERVKVLCLHGGDAPGTQDAAAAAATAGRGRKKRASWNAPSGNFHSHQVSNWLYRRDGNRVVFDERTKERHNNPWGHVHPKMLLAVFKSDSSDGGATMHWAQESDDGSAMELLRTSVLTHGPFGGGVCNGRCEYSAWYSELFPVDKFGSFKTSEFGVHLGDFMVKLVEAADREYANNPEYYPPETVRCQCDMGKYGACKSEAGRSIDARPSCTELVVEMLRVVTHADCGAADAAGFKVVSSVIGCTERTDQVQYAHLRVNNLAHEHWGSKDRRMPRTPEGGRESGQAKAPTYADLMSEEEKESGLSLVVIVHNIAAGCTPRFLRNFQSAWKIPSQRNVKVIWPASACLMGDPDNQKIEHLVVPWGKGFDHTYRADTYSMSGYLKLDATIKDTRHALWQGDDHDGFHYLWKYEPHALLPTPRQFGRWGGWKDDDVSTGFLSLDAPPDGAPDDKATDTQLLQAAPLRSDTISAKEAVAAQEKATWGAEDHSRTEAAAVVTDWRRSGGKVSGAEPGDSSISAFSHKDLHEWAERVVAGQALQIKGLDRDGRKRVRGTIRDYNELSTVLTTEAIGFGPDRWLRLTKQSDEERYYCHHFQQYILVDKDQKPRAFLLTSANLSSFAWGDQSQCGEELPSFGLVLDRDKRGENEAYNAQTPSHDFWMRNFEFGIMDLQPGRRKGRAASTPQTPEAEKMSRAARPHALPINVDLQNLKPFERWEEPWCSKAHERLCSRVDEKHMMNLQERLLSFAHPDNLGTIFPMDTALTLTERSQVRMICREICDPEFDRLIPALLRADREPSEADKLGGQTRVRSGRVGQFSPALWLDHYVREAPGTVYGTQLVITVTTKEDYLSRQPSSWNTKWGPTGAVATRAEHVEYDCEGRAVDANGSQRRSQ